MTRHPSSRAARWHLPTAHSPAGHRTSGQPATSGASAESKHGNTSQKPAATGSWAGSAQQGCRQPEREEGCSSEMLLHGPQHLTAQRRGRRSIESHPPPKPLVNRPVGRLVRNSRSTARYAQSIPSNNLLAPRSGLSPVISGAAGKGQRSAPLPPAEQPRGQHSK